MCQFWWGEIYLKLFIMVTFEEGHGGREREDRFAFGLVALLHYLILITVYRC